MRLELFMGDSYFNVYKNNNGDGIMKVFSDDIWLWGQNAGSHHGLWNLPGINKLETVEGAAFLGIKNCCRVVMSNNPTPPFDEESAKLAGFEKVVWSVTGDSSSKRNDLSDDCDEVLRQAALFPNVTGGVMDDFFRPEEKSARFTVEKVREIARKLHNAPRQLELWLVYYAALLDIDYRDYLDAVDVITFWSWNSAELAKAKENIERVISGTPAKKHYAGCYLYNYGDDRPLTAQEMLGQMHLYLDFWKTGKIDGVIVCSNAVADLGLEAVDVYLDFMKKYGNTAK